jgi:23S rRNA (cytidine1920-2'-O)/16S rRNA (cytidine1409-2'-O)-methyltransferase
VKARQRLDVLLVERGLATTRERARAIIMAGLVTVDGQRVDKAGTPIVLTAEIAVSGPALRYVSRGGLKLERALEAFQLSPADRICLDVGASTGGFTDCMLQHGALKVYAIDVGYGQLDQRLRADPRVFSHERVNARNLGADVVPETVSLIVIDVSFISLSKVIGAAVGRADAEADVVALVKPQFEAGPRDVGKGGVVRDAAVHRRVLHEAAVAIAQTGLVFRGLVPSPIHGPAGNVEFLLWARRTADPAALQAVDVNACIEEAVVEAHSSRPGPVPLSQGDGNANLREFLANLRERE